MIEYGWSLPDFGLLMWIEQRVYDLARSRSLPESIKTPYFNDNIKSVMILWENNTNSQMWKDWSPSRFMIL